MTWALARRICNAREEYPPELMIDDLWLDEWRFLSRSEAGWHSFPEYIDVKIENLEAEFLFEGFSFVERRNDDYSEPTSRNSWYRELPDHDLQVAMGFRLITPFEQRPSGIYSGRKRDRAKEVHDGDT